MILRYLHNLTNYSVLFFSLLLYSHFFYYILWQETIGPKLIWLFLFGCLAINVLLLRKIKGKDSNLGIVLFLLLAPPLAALLKSVFKSQSIESERITILMFFAVTQYFLIKSMNVTEKQIVNTFTFYGLITLILQIYQQQPESIPLFGIIGNDEANAGIDRNGILRFYIGSYFIAIVLFYYWWTRILQKLSIKNVLFFVCFAASIYLYLIRQLMAVSLLTLFISVFLINN